MGDSSERNGKWGETGVIELTGKIMVVAIVLLFFVVIFVFALHLYAKWFWYRRQESTTAAATTTTRRRRRFDFAAGHQEMPVISVLNGGLDPLILKTLPIVIFDDKQFKDGLECSVCLCDVSEGEKARLLPKCNHGFHVDCIDMWFQSHSTCPLCRNPVSDSESTLGTILQDNVEVQNFPTNVLIWGDETQVSTFDHQDNNNNNNNGIQEPSSSNGALMIDIPRSMMNDEEESKSPVVPTRLRSLKRLLSGNRRVNPSSPRGVVDLEQGS